MMLQSKKQLKWSIYCNDDVDLLQWSIYYNDDVDFFFRRVKKLYFSNEIYTFEKQYFHMIRLNSYFT